DDREARIRIRQRWHRGLAPGQILETFLLLQRPGLLEHLRRHVDAGDVTRHAGKCAGEPTGSARDIEHVVVWRRRRHPDDPIERLLVADLWGRGKGRRLLAELIEDPFLVLALHVGRLYCADPPTHG